MGQSITVVEKKSPRRNVVRFETNRSLTGMGHERYARREDATGVRPVDELARRLFDRGGIDGVHVYSNVITVDLGKGSDSDGIETIIRELFIHYVPGVVPPTDAELEGASGEGTSGEGTSG